MEQQDKKEETVKVNELNQDQLKKMTDGLAVKDVTLMPGWKIIEGWLKSRAFHSWVDPRGLSKEEWEWAEMNAFHSADVAKEIMQDVYEAVNEAEQLQDFRMGKGKPSSMKI